MAKTKVTYVFKRSAPFCLRLLIAPVKGAIQETRLAWYRTSNNWREFFVNDIRRYFAPITGAVRGLSRELKRIRTPRIRTIKRR